MKRCFGLAVSCYFQKHACLSLSYPRFYRLNRAPVSFEKGSYITAYIFDPTKHDNKTGNDLRKCLTCVVLTSQ